MSGFSPSLMSGLMQANTALMTAQQHTNAISRMDTQKATLQAEIKSGVGDVEGKQAEIEKIDTQREKATALQQEAMNQASASLGVATAPEKAENEKADATNKDDTTDKDDTKESQVTAKASQKAEELRNAHQDTNVAAVNYSQDMRIAEEGKTNVAISPEFLEKMADSADLSASYEDKVGTMHDLSGQDAPAHVQSQTWAIDKNGSIRHYSTLAQDTSAEDAQSWREAADARGREAFGAAFAGAYVRTEGQPATAPAAPGTQNAGILIDLSL